MDHSPKKYHRLLKRQFKKAEGELKVTSENLAMAQAQAKLGSFSYQHGNFENGYWSPQLYKVLGLSKDH